MQYFLKLNLKSHRSINNSKFQIKIKINMFGAGTGLLKEVSNQPPQFDLTFLYSREQDTTQALKRQ